MSATQSRRRAGSPGADGADALRVLSLVELNRATLARQHLLERATLDPVAAIEALAGLQAQEPPSPYIGLWTRLADFRAASLDEAIRDRRVVKATLMRMTLHLATRDDYLRFLAGVMPTFGQRIGRAFRERTMPPLDALVDAALRFAEVPRTTAEMKAFLAPLVEEGADPVWVPVLLKAPFIRTPEPVTWSYGRRPAFVSADAWLGGASVPSEAAGMDRLVLRHLTAFGPASVADIASWSRVEITRIRSALQRLAGALGLRTFRDEDGRTLYDIADGPLPPADTPAPPRFLPMWDGVLLGYSDRRRTIADEHKGRVIMKNGDHLPIFLADGRVSGLWWTERSGSGTLVRYEPFRALTAEASRELDEEAERLAAFLSPLDPQVYGRYRRTWMRDVAG